MTMRQANEMVGKNQTTVAPTRSACDDDRRRQTDALWPFGCNILWRPSKNRSSRRTRTAERNRSLSAAAGARQDVHLPARAGREWQTDRDRRSRQPAADRRIRNRRATNADGRPPESARAVSRRPHDRRRREARIAQATSPSQIFNLGDKFGEVTRFTLTLRKVQTEDGATCAVFQADVEAASNAATQMRLEVEGPLVVDVATCRAHKIQPDRTNRHVRNTRQLQHGLPGDRHRPLADEHRV